MNYFNQNMSEVFIVYTYNRTRCSGSREQIIGTYLCIEDAIQRVKTYGKSPYKYTPGVYYSKDGFVTFVEKYPLGDCKNIEMFTTRVDF